MSQPEDEPDTRLRRSVSGRLLYLFVLGDVLGAGVYALVGEVAGEVGGAIWVPLLVALLLSLLTAASYAELVTKYPRAGGSAVFAQKAFRRPEVAFLVGFCMLAAGVTSAAGLALAFSGDYLGVFVDVPAVPAALVFLALVAALNARGIQESLRANMVMTLVESSGLVLVVSSVPWSSAGATATSAARWSSPRGRRWPRRCSRRRCWPTTPSSASRPRPTWPRRSATCGGSTRGRCSARC